MNELYVWCMMNWGHLPDSRYTGTLQKQSEVSMCALWMSAIGSAPCDQGRGGTDTGGIAVRWSVRGCRHVAVDWMGFWGEEHLCFCPVAMWGRGREENLPVWHPNRGSGFLITHSLRSWAQTGSRAGLMPFRSLSLWPGHPRSLYDRSFFGVFWCSY